MDFEQQLRSTGGNVLVSVDDGGRGYAGDTEFRYLYQADKVCVAVEKDFDRWANSRDFVLHRSLDKVDLDVLRRACRTALQQRHHDEDRALGYDVAQQYRQASRSKA